jgi:predicted RNase H-like nuclease (RuvC/YqgF family)
MLDEMKVERQQHTTLEWTAHNQEQRDALSAFLRRAQALTRAPA